MTLPMGRTQINAQAVTNMIGNQIRIRQVLDLFRRAWYPGSRFTTILVGMIVCLSSIESFQPSLTFQSSSQMKAGIDHDLLTQKLF